MNQPIIYTDNDNHTADVFFLPLIMIKTICILAFVSTTMISHAQVMDVLFYNVENLFDTIQDLTKDDKDFLPTAKNAWNTQKYFEKINHIQQVFELLPNLGLVGLAEIENRKVLEDLIKSGKRKLEIIHQESLDERGIDVALLYDSKLLTFKKSSILRFVLEKDEELNYTRDILCAEFLFKKQKLHVLVNHWPSRRGGQEASDNFRITAAKNAKNYIDSVQKAEPDSKIIFMGDLNDYAENTSTKMISSTLKPMITKNSGKYGGTSEYKGLWDVLDHLMVSQNFFTKGKLKLVGEGRIIEDDFLISIYKDKPVPFRTYAGKYLGGYSDHLPVTIQIKY